MAGEKYLVRIEPDQAPVLFALLQANAASSTVAIEHLSQAEFETSFFASSMYWFYRDKDDVHAIVHLSNIDPIARKAEFGVVSLRRREGNATAACYALFALAFRSMGLHRLYCVVNADNGPCMAMIKKEGALTQEATLRQNRLRDGAFIDQYMYSILATEVAKWDRRTLAVAVPAGAR